VFIPVIVEDWSMKFYYAGSLAVALLLVSCVFAVPSVNAANAAENSWETMAPMPTARCVLRIGVVNGKIYAIGGQTSSGSSDVNEMYDPATNTWVTKKPMPTPQSGFAIAVVRNKIYCIGGEVNQVYDPATDTWETKQPMPIPRGALSASVVNDKIYAIGGVVPYVELPIEMKESDLNEVYDPVADSWTIMAPLPTAVVHCISAVMDNKIYVFGNGDTVQIYEPQTNTWSYGPSSAPMSYGAVAATTGVCAPKKIYLIGGGSINQIFDPKTETWSTGAAMPTPRQFFSVAVVDDLLYVIGGENWQGGVKITYDVNERYTPLGYGTPDPSYDATPPEITLISPENKTYYNTSVPLEIPLEFSVNKQAFRVWYKLDGENNTEITGNTTLTGLAVGVHNVTVYAADHVGNVGASETVTFTIAEPEPFPTVPVAAVSTASAAAVGAGLIAYFKKRRRQPSPHT
jgi:N-acetylneuraminic acid mutarotase